MVEVYLTVDTETSIGGAWANPQFEPVAPERAILGRIGAEYYGTPLIMDILEESGLRGTFFTEVLSAQVVSESQLAEAYSEIVRRGHDPQLHLHPVYHFYHLFRQGRIRREQLPPNMDLIGRHPLQTQIELLQAGCELFRKFTAKAPVAFRAGCYGGSSSTFSALETVGLRYDSSFNAAYLGTNCSIDGVRSINTPWRAGAVWEVPVTNFETGFWKMRGLKPLDIGAVSLLEMRRVLDEAERFEISPVVFIMHSFTLFKKADVQFRQLRPDRLVIRRFRELCRFLSKKSDRFKVRTFAEQPQFSHAQREVPLPRVGSFLPVCRKFVQGMNRLAWI
jgi:hypothetical protein